MTASTLDMNVEAKRIRCEESNKDALRVLNLSKTYPNKFEALKKINFGVKRKEIFGLLGPNGAGKSTTFNILTGMITRSDGDIHMINRDPGKDSNLSLNIGICP